MDILEFLNKIKKYDKNALEKIIAIEANNLEPEITEIQKQQLSEGKNANGEIIGTYTPFTEFIASQSNPIKPKKAGKPYNFQWSGNLFKGLFSKSKLLSNNDLLIETDSKAAITDELEGRYSNLLGIEQPKQQAITELLTFNTVENINNLIK